MEHCIVKEWRGSLHTCLFFPWACYAVCGISAPQPGTELMLRAVEMRSLNHWTPPGKSQEWRGSLLNYDEVGRTPSKSKKISWEIFYKIWFNLPIFKTMFRCPCICHTQSYTEKQKIHKPLTVVTLERWYKLSLFTYELLPQPSNECYQHIYSIYATKMPQLHKMTISVYNQV